MYWIEDENGNELIDGEIEGYVWEYFYDNKFEVDNFKVDFIVILIY